MSVRDTISTLILTKLVRIRDTINTDELLGHFLKKHVTSNNIQSSDGSRPYVTTMTSLVLSWQIKFEFFTCVFEHWNEIFHNEIIRVGV